MKTRYRGDLKAEIKAVTEMHERIGAREKISKEDLERRIQRAIDQVTKRWQKLYGFRYGLTNWFKRVWKAKQEGGGARECARRKRNMWRTPIDQLGRLENGRVVAIETRAKAA